MRVRSNMKLEESWCEHRSRRKVILSKMNLWYMTILLKYEKVDITFLTSVWEGVRKCDSQKLIVAVELYDR